MTWPAYVFSSVVCFMSVLVLIRVKAPYGFFLWLPNALAAALAPIGILFGGIGVLLGILSGAYLAGGIGGMGLVILSFIIRQITQPNRAFETCFGADWIKKIPAPFQKQLVNRRWPLLWKDSSGLRMQQNLVFAVLPETGRKLLCDLWQPSPETPRSGLAFLYFHGSGWYMLDKDYGTRPFFRHLTAQGHVVMDVAYRLFPEVGIPEMVGDVKRAVNWMKVHAREYGLDPQKIVLAGGSAGGHIALLAAFSPLHPRMTPEDLLGEDLSVRAVVSCYGPTDLTACYEHTGQSRLLGKTLVVAQMTPSERRINAGRLDLLLGGHPSEIPADYALFSPVNHVHTSCPPTLLIQGELDWVTPVQATREMARKMSDAGASVVNIVYPYTNHGFDLFFPQISLSAQSALYEIDRFLAMMV